jgi:hypothetical protein
MDEIQRDAIRLILLPGSPERHPNVLNAPRAEKPAGMNLKLWDEDRQRLVGFRELKRLRSMPPVTALPEIDVGIGIKLEPGPLSSAHTSGSNQGV